MRTKTRAWFALTGMLALLLIGVAGFGAAWAWNTHRAQQVNQLESRTVSVAVAEEFLSNTVDKGETKIKTVTVQNTGNAAAFVRVSYAEYWTTATEQLAGATNVEKNWTTDWKNDFKCHDDGWYYYKKVLPAGRSVQVLESVTFPASVTAGASYHLDFQVETVQVSDEAAVNTDATKTLFGRTAEVTDMTTSYGAVTGGTVTWTN